MDTKAMAKQVRLSKWASILRERRESGRSVRSWCQEKGISEKTYYYWQRKLREAACERLEEANVPKQMVLGPAGFAQVRVEEPSLGTAKSSPASPEAFPEASGHLQAEIGGVRITASGGYPPEKLAALLRELMRHAEYRE